MMMNVPLRLLLRCQALSIATPVELFMSSQKKSRFHSVAFLSAGSAACIAEIGSLPFDTAKVRMQLQNAATKSATSSSAQQVPYKSIADALRRIAAEEGVTALYKGLSPGLQRQMLFAGTRISLYEPVRDFYHSERGDPPLIKKILAGLTTGAIGITIANPTDVVKVRLQAEGRLPPGVPRQYTGAFDAYSKIIKQDGIRGLWRGYVPNVFRNSTINAAELASYDQIKQSILAASLMEDDVPAHLVSGAGAGFIATVIGSPVDVLKTRMMSTDSQGQRVYSSIFDCIKRSYQASGVGTFYQGFWANFARIGSWNVIMFLSFEQIKSFTMKQGWWK